MTQTQRIINYPALKGAILHHLDNNASVKRKDLLKYLRDLGHDITDRTMRATVEAMVVQDAMPIQSSEKGYKIIRNEQDFKDAISYLDAKAKAIAIRKNCLISNYEKTKKFVNQIALF